MNYEGIQTSYAIHRGRTFLTILVDITFQKLRKTKVILLPKLKERTLKDCVVTSPRIIVSAFTKTLIIDSFVFSGMIDGQTKSCADVYTLTNSFKIDWHKVDGGKVCFMSILPEVINEMYCFGEVREAFYDKNDFLVDKYNDCKVWRLSSTADHLTRSKVVYHPSVIAREKEDIRIWLQAKTTNQMKIYQDSMSVIDMNKDCGVKVIDLAVKGTREFSEDKFDMLSQATIQMFDLQKAGYLVVFYRVRVQEDLNGKI